MEKQKIKKAKAKASSDSDDSDDEGEDDDSDLGSELSEEDDQIDVFGFDVDENRRTGAYAFQPDEDEIDEGILKNMAFPPKKRIQDASVLKAGKEAKKNLGPWADIRVTTTIEGRLDLIWGSDVELENMGDDGKALLRCKK